MKRQNRNIVFHGSRTNRERKNGLTDKRKGAFKTVPKKLSEEEVSTIYKLLCSNEYNGKSLKYAIDAWQHLMNYLDCPEIYLDNSVSERSIRPSVLSRKNFLFSASEYGSRSICLLFSLIECVKISNLNLEEYLSSRFELAADTTGQTDSKWSELLPWNIKLIKKSDVSTVLIV